VLYRLVLFGKETVKTFSTNVLIQVTEMFLRRKIFSNEIRNEVKSGDQAIFEMKSLDQACGKWSESWSCYRRNNLIEEEFCLLDPGSRCEVSVQYKT